jgi:hypothetical protein
MALQKQTIGIPLVSGVDLRTDHKLAEGMLELENASFKTPGAISKRDGFSYATRAYTSSDPAETQIPGNIKSIYRFRDAIMGHDGQYMYTLAGGKWRKNGQELSPNKFTALQISRTAFPILKPDPAVAAVGYDYIAPTFIDIDVVGNLIGAVVSYQDTTAPTFSIYMYILDATTGSVVYQEKMDPFSSTEGFCRICAIDDNTFLATCTDFTGGVYKIRALPYIISTSSTQSPYYLVDAPSTGFNLFAASRYDICATGSGLGVVGWKATDALVKMTKFSALGGALSTLSWAGSAMDTSSVPYCDYNGHDCAFMIYNDTNALKSVGITVSSATASNAGAVYVLDAATAFGYTKVTGAKITDIGTVSNYDIYYSGNTTVSATATTMNVDVTRKVNFTPSTGAFSSGAAAIIMRCTDLSNGAVAYNGKSYILGKRVPTYLGVSSPPYSTHKVADSSGGHICAYLHDAGRARTVTGFDRILPKTVRLADGVFVSLAMRLSKLIGQAATTPYYSIDIVKYDFNHVPQQTALADSTLFSGASAWSYDGDIMTELGFFYPPTIVANAIAGGSLTASASYVVTAVYEWIDANGRMHRSQPSNEITVPTTGVNKTLEVLALPYHNTNKSPVKIVIYTTDANGPVFRYQKDITNDVTVNGVSGTVLAYSTTAAQIYTTGSVVYNQQPEGVESMCVRDDRIYAASNNGQVWFSKPVLAGEGIAFSPFLVKEIDKTGGAISAVGAVDGYTVVAKENAVHAFGGEGPGNNALNDRFTSVRKISGDVGCDVGAPVVSVPDGLIMKGKKGVFLVDRSLQVQFIGAPIEELKTQKLVSAAQKSADNEIVLGFLGAGTAIYNWVSGMWSVDQSRVHYGPGAVVADKYVYPPSAGAVAIQSPGLYVDNGDFYPLKIGTSWIKAAGIGGWQRIYYVNLVGEFKTPHNLVIGIYHDYSETPTETIETGTASLMDSGGYRIRFKPSRQKCEAIRFVIYDKEQGLAGESYSLSAIVLEVGVKPGTAKLAPGKTV